MKTNEQFFIDKIIDAFKEDYQGSTADDKTLMIKIRNKTIEIDDYNDMDFNELVNVIKEEISDENN
ncbi:MAG TPA: hypothetical protein IAB45_03475 [Candidatus Onthousia faecavium]|nr:hypothetical protein [Candidatus Onthousia faecavium]